MIGLIAAMAFQNPGVLTFPDPTLSDTCVAAVVKLPQLGGQDWQTLELIAQVLPEGSLTYSRRTIIQLTDGNPLHVVLQPDALIVSVDAPAAKAANAVKVIASILTEPDLDQSELDEGADQLAAQKPRYYDEAISRIKYGLGHLQNEVALNLFQRIFRPDKVTVAFGGAGGFGEMQAQWTDLTSKWEAQDVDSDPNMAPAEPVLSRDEVQGLMLHGPGIAANSPDLPADMLAMYGLGVGKGSSLFRIPREKHAWSYRQEAFLWPTLTGWEPRLFMASLRKNFSETMISDLKKDLSDDVNAWTEDDRSRAIQMMEATLIRGVPYGAVWLGTQPVGDTLQDRTEMADYWQAKTGQKWDPAKLIDTCRTIDLAQMKAAALRILGG